MHGPHEATRKAPQRGLFLFFVLGMFMLQIAFAFTIHGDIGPRTAVAPGIDRPAPPALVGRIDSLLTSARASGSTNRPVGPHSSAVTPVTAIAPAQRLAPAQVAKASSARVSPIAPVTAPSVAVPAHTPIKAVSATRSDAGTAALKTSSGGRYLEYTITRGDTLDSISRKLYGSTQMVTALVRLNRLTDDRTLRCGETLRVPRVGLVVASR